MRLKFLEWLLDLLDTHKRKIYALIDCNSFFCSCERVFLPSLNDKPVGVVSGADGCFVSCSYELKKIGVKVGTPYFKVKELCQYHDVEVFTSNFSLYRNFSDRVMMVIAKFSPHCEIYSIDEAFIDITHIKEDQLDNFVREIKRVVEQDTGIPVSIGVSYTKTLCKIAGLISKKSDRCKGVMTLLDEASINNALYETDIGDVWGIGTASALKMRSMGISNAKDLKDYRDDKRIRDIYGILGLQKKEELGAIIHFFLNETSSKKKQIMYSRSFTTPLFNIKEIEKAVTHFCFVVCEKLRAQSSFTKEVCIFIRTSRFKKEIYYQNSQMAKFDVATCDTRKVITKALSALESIYRPGYAYKKIGVIISNFVDQDEIQTDLFSSSDKEVDEGLMGLIDLINRKEGKGTLSFGLANKLTTKQKASGRALGSINESPRYVSSWDELPIAL